MISMASKMTDKEAVNDKVDRILKGVKIWTAFYRANPHRFAKDYLNLNLKPFQQILLFFMNICTNFVFIAARGRQENKAVLGNIGRQTPYGENAEIIIQGKSCMAS